MKENKQDQQKLNADAFPFKNLFGVCIAQGLENKMKQMLVMAIQRATKYMHFFVLNQGRIMFSCYERIKIPKVEDKTMEW